MRKHPKNNLLGEPLRIRYRWLALVNLVNFYAVVYCFGLATDGEPRALVPAGLIGLTLVLTVVAEFKYEGWRD